MSPVHRRTNLFVFIQSEFFNCYFSVLMYVCVYVWVCYWPPVHVLCQNHEVVVFQPQTVTAPYLGSVANITTILALLPNLFQSCSGYSFSPLPGHISYCSPIFHPSTPLLSLFLPASPLLILIGSRATVHLDGALTHRPPPLVCASLPYWSGQVVIYASLWLPYLTRFPPLWCPRPAPRSLSVPLVILYEGPFLPLPASIICTHTYPPCRPRLAVQSPAGPEWLAPSSSVPSPLWIRLAFPVFCSVSLCILEFDLSFGCPFALGREAWAPPLPSNHSFKPLPLRYLAILSLFRLPPTSTPSLSLRPSPLDPIQTLLN